MRISHHARQSFQKQLRSRVFPLCCVCLLFTIISIASYKSVINHQSMISFKATSGDPTYTLRTFLSIESPCTHGFAQYSCYASIISLAQQRQRQRYITLLVLTNATRHLVLNWCISAHTVRLKNYVLVALDSASFQFFSNLRAPVVKVSRASAPTSRSEVWIRRTLLAYVLLLNGFHVLISDADAIAVRSPFLDLLSNPFYDSFDIIASPSNFPNPSRGELPQECSVQFDAQWRYQPCMGWILMRSNANTKRFFSQLFVPSVLKYADDQLGLACALRNAQQSWNADHSWSSTENTVIRFRNPMLSMVMLPASRFVRNCTRFKHDKLRNYGIWKFDIKKVALFHCKGWDKRANAENNGVWYLQEYWRDVSSSGSPSFDAYLQRISRKKDISDK